jgi:chorismate mutase
MSVRAIRGATQVEADDREQIIDRTAELVRAVLDRNDVDPADLISVVFTATPDLTAEFPAYAARAMGITDVPLLAHVESPRSRADLRHVYLHGAQALRTDLPR